MTLPTRSITLALICCLCGCSGELGTLPVYPLEGQVFVDGKPGEHVQVYCHRVPEMDQSHPTLPGAITDRDGRFKISTFVSGDGLPEGQYVLTFSWRNYDPLSGNFGGEDRLDDRYADWELNRQEPGFCVTVEKGKQIRLEPIRLAAR